MVGSLARDKESLLRDKESLLRDRRSQQVMSPPSLLELRLGSVGLTGTTRSAGLCGSAGLTAGPRDWKTHRTIRLGLRAVEVK